MRRFPHRRSTALAGALAGAAGCLLAGLLPRPASGSDFQITPGAPNLVRFESRAPLESFEGKTRQVRGHVKLDPDSLGAWMEVLVEVDLASLDTRIELRNKHMRENHLETAKYPKTVFLGGKVHDLKAARLEPGQTVAFEIEGVFDLHGVKKPLRAPVEMTYSRAEGVAELHVVSRFQVKLPDFEIKRPKFLVMQLDEVQRVSIDLVAREAGAKPPSGGTP
jgi:polyisoprenoid-binding protein YceI